jgi:large subunit ribosomal protein L6
MSRIGKIPIEIKEGITIDVSSELISVKGPKGELSVTNSPRVNIEVKDNNIYVTRKTDQKEDKAFHGLYRSLINNMVIGVTEGFSKDLEIRGIGYRVAMDNDNLVINVGYSHSVTVKKVEGINFSIIDNNFIKVEGIDKQLVGQVAANIRSIRKPEPYKGKGIRYKDEVVIKKAGKTAKVAK